MKSLGEKSTKKPYYSPQLLIYGTIHEIIKSVDTVGYADDPGSLRFAHDMKKALMVIMANISLAQTHIRPGGKIFEPLKNAEKVCLRANELTQKFITFSKGRTPAT